MCDTRDSRTRDLKFALREKNFVIPGMAAAQASARKGERDSGRARSAKTHEGAATQARRKQAKMKLKARALL